MRQKNFLILLSFGILALLYQNCQGTYLSENVPAIEAPPSAGQTRKLKRSHLYLGGQNRIRHFIWNADTLTLEDKGQTQSLGYVHWISYDATSEFVFANHFDQPGVAIFKRNSVTGDLTPFANHAISQGVHFNLIRLAENFLAVIADYAAGKITIARIGLTGIDSTPVAAKTFSAGAKTHSSSFDQKRGIFHVANLGENAVKFFRMVDGNFVEAGDYKVAAPRTVVFDSTFDRLYINTEVPNGNGQGVVKILSFDSDSQGSFIASEVGSLPIGDRGADIQVNSDYKFAVSAVRQSQKESLAIIPLNSKGELDPNNPGQSFPIPFAEPRSLRILGDGKAVFLTPNSQGSDLVIYSINKESLGKPLGIQLLKEADAGGEYFPCNFAIDEFEE